jgi:hypothetical protein
MIPRQVSGLGWFEPPIIAVVQATVPVQCNTNINFLTEYEFEYIHNLDFDRIQIPNIFVPMKLNIHIRILDTRCLIFEFIPNICRISSKPIPNMHRIYIHQVNLTEYEYQIYLYEKKKKNSYSNTKYSPTNIWIFK